MPALPLALNRKSCFNRATYHPMNTLDHFWNVPHDKAIKLLKVSLARTTETDAAHFRKLQDENNELRLRLGLLIRLLIERGIFNADDFATLLNDTKAKLAASDSATLPGRTRSTAARASSPAPAIATAASSARARRARRQPAH
jgi:hypothetical protein